MTFASLWLREKFLPEPLETVVIPQIVEVPRAPIELHNITTATVREHLPDTTETPRRRRVRQLVQVLDTTRTELAALGYEREIVVDTILAVTLDTVQVIFDDITARPRSIVLRQAPEKIVISDYATYIPPAVDERSLWETIGIPVACFAAGILVDHYLIRENTIRENNR